MLIKLIIFVLNIALIYARWEGTVYAHTYSGDSYFIGSTYNCNTMYVCLGQETEGINDGGTEVNPGIIAEYYKLTDCINSKGESAYNQDSKLKNPFKACSVSKVHVQGPCYNSPDLDHPDLEIIHGNGHDTIQYVKKYNGLYLTDYITNLFYYRNIQTIHPINVLTFTLTYEIIPSCCFWIIVYDLI